MAYAPDMVPLQYVYLPTAYSREEKLHWLAQVATTPLPGVVLNDTGASVPEMLEHVTPLLPPGMTVPSNPERILFEREMGGTDLLADVGLHIDRDPVSPRQKEIDINLNLGIVDIAEWIILRFAPEALERPRSMELLNAYCTDAQAAMRRGKVDPKLFLHIGYRATVHPGQTLAFKEGEPLAHEVTTVTPTRTSEAVIGKLAITPGLELTRYKNRRARRASED